MTTFVKRLDVHFVACAAAAGAGLAGTAQTAEATVVYSGIVNVPIPNTSAGIYLNTNTGGVFPGPAGVPPTLGSGWDINVYFFPGIGFYGSNSGGAPLGPNQVLFVGTGVAFGPATNLAPGTLISAASTFNSGAGASVGSGVNFPVSSTGILGYRFYNELTLTNHYAWARIQQNPAGQGGVLIDYAWENAVGAGILAGAVPAPGSLALLALGGVGLAARRRK